MTGELALVGRVAGERVRGRVLAGFAPARSMRLEGVAPFGPPAFVLAADDDGATLWLPRDRRVARDPSAERLLDALVGVGFAGDALKAIVTGCVTPMPQAIGGRLHDGGWASIDLAGGATLYLRRRGGQWALLAARRDGWRFDYDMWQGGLPRRVRLVSMPTSGTSVDLQAAVTQLMTNVELPSTAFTVDVPEETQPLAVEELRRGTALRP